MKRVLYVHHGDINGGAPRSLKYLLSKIDRNKYEPYVICRVNETDTKYFIDGNTKVIFDSRIRPFHGSTVSGIDFKQIGYNFVYALPTYFEMKKIVKYIKPDVVHLNSSCLFMCAMAVKHVNKNIKVICHIREPLLPNMWGAILRIMCNKFCDQFIAIDEFDGKTVDPKCKKTSVIYNFVDFSIYNSSVKSNILRQELKLTNEDIIFLVLARLSPENGVLEIVKQWSENCCKKEQQLVIVGEIPGREIEYSKKCHAIADGVSNIHILSFREDVQDVIASSDVIMCPFTAPHFARSIIEGAAMGKPAISKWIDGPKELIIENETGIFYNKDGLFNLKEQVEKLQTDAEYRKLLGEKAEKHARYNFNADKNATRTFEFYL